MSRIEPIPACRALVVPHRREPAPRARRDDRRKPDGRRRRASDRLEGLLCPAPSAAAFEAQSLARRGLKADLGVRRQWTAAYAAAARAPDQAPSVCACA